MLEKTLESPLDYKEIKLVNLKGNQSWIFIGRTDAEAEAWILWPPDVKSRLTGEAPDAGKDWGQEKETTEDEMVGWHHWLNGHELQQSPLDDEGQGSVLCCSPWGHKGSDTTKWLNNNNPMENCRSPYSLWAALMSKLKCSYWDAFSLVLFWMKNNACPSPPKDWAKDGETLYSQQKQDWELTVAHIMNSLLQNSDLNWRK